MKNNISKTMRAWSLSAALMVSLGATVNVSGQGLTFVTHGMNSSGTEAWVQSIKNGINSKTPSWTAIAYDWKSGADVLPIAPNYALDHAFAEGKSAADQLNLKQYNAIHLIAHSAGSRLIAEYAHELRVRGYDGIIQITYLDAYTPSTIIYNPEPPSALSALNFLARANTGANLTEHYYSDGSLLNGDYPYTSDSIPMPASNYNVTNASGSDESHSWPYKYYQRTIDNPGYAPGQGFAYAIEQSAFAKMWVSVSGTTTIDTYRPGVSTVDAGPFNWYSGIMSGTLENYSTQFIISNSTAWSAPVAQNSLLVNAATVTQNAGAILQLAAGSIDNRSGAMWEFLGAGQITGSGSITNSGVFGSDSSGTVLVGSGVKFINTGTLFIGSGGRLTLNGGGSSSGGSLDAGSGAVLELGGAFVFSHAGMRDGTLEINATGTLTVSGNYTQGADATLNLVANNIAPSLVIGGTATLDGTLGIGGVSGQSGTATLLRADGGIIGNFTTVNGVSGSSAKDYLSLTASISADRHEYLLDYSLSWFANSAAHGNFTIAGGESFEVGVALTPQGAGQGWDGHSLTKRGAGTLTLSAINTYTGDTTVSEGTLTLGAAHAIAASRAVSVSNGATFSLGGFDQRLNDLVNNGMVEFVSLGRTLTVTNLSGDGSFRMDIDIHNQVADLLDVTGASSGAHWLSLDNQNGEQITGDENPLQVVRTADGGASFSGTVNSGMFRFSATIQKGDDLDAAAYDNFSADANAWYVALLTDSDTGGGGGSAPVDLSPLGNAVLNTAAGVPALWFAQNDALHKRLGDLRARFQAPPPPLTMSATSAERSLMDYIAYGNNPPPAPDSAGAGAWLDNLWVRGFGQQANLTVSGLERFRQTQYGVDFGTDHAWRPDADNVLYTGVFAGYGGADRDLRAGFSGKTRSGYGGLYGTWMNGGGWYADAVAKGQYFRNEFSGDDQAKYDSLGVGASVEAGRFIAFTGSGTGGGWFVEPGARVAYLRLMNDDYTTDRGLSARLADADVLQLYGGARLGHTFIVSGGWLQPYFKAGALEQLSAGGQVRASGGEWRPTTDGFRVIVGAGLAWQINPDHQLHLDYEADFGDHYRAPWSVNFGYLHQF
ncbi:MAG: autotransporter outer membrane beta-barrel domain-containing protein [Verrucomicrobiales bacterium]|jgi:outer membrane autotransporter protein|nr:autotransporter outer membrane beta-barrel domain-containing protein [Verrucomicrobiales bacterium]